MTNDAAPLTHALEAFAERERARLSTRDTFTFQEVWRVPLGGGGCVIDGLEGLKRLVRMVRVGTDTIVYAFIDPETGDVLDHGGWSLPTQTVLANVFADASRAPAQSTAEA
jgi:hypothetical protein